MVLNPHMRVVALAGGVGGAKLALGLSRVLPPELEAELARLGVKRPPPPPQPQTKYPKPWVPTYPGEDPPF